MLRSPPDAAAGDPAHGGGISASEISPDRASWSALDHPAIDAIDPPVGEWAEPAAGDDLRGVYNAPTFGHPPPQWTPSNGARLAVPASEAYANTGLLPAGQAIAPAPQCVSPPRPDGHTRARIVADPEGFSPALVAVIAELQRPRTADEERAERATGLLVRWLPTPSCEGKATAFEISVMGTRRQILTFYCVDRVHIYLNCESGEVRIDWKAKELWSQPWAVTGARWISDLSELLFGQSCTLADAFALGWRMTGIELCADYVGFPIDPADAGHFAGGLKPAGEGLYLEAAETLSLGKRSTSNVSLCIYDKSTQIRDDKGGDDATYRSSWIAGGYRPDDRCGECPECRSWAPIAVRPPCRFTRITRVEIRLQRYGLRLAVVDRTPGASVNSRIIYDFRNPATLASTRAIEIIWGHCTRRHRLVTPERSRLRRGAIDPRWKVVIASGGVEPPALRQFREINADAWEKKVERSVRLLVQSAEHLAALHCVKPEGVRGLAQIARFAYTMAMRYGDDLEAHGDAYFSLVCPFVGPEIWRLGARQWADYEKAEGVTGIQPRNFSYWTQRGALDRALSQTGPPGSQPREREADDKAGKATGTRQAATQRGDLCGDL